MATNPIRCPHCQAALHLPAGPAGRRVKCPRCGKQFAPAPPAGAPRPGRPAPVAAPFAPPPGSPPRAAPAATAKRPAPVAAPFEPPGAPAARGSAPVALPYRSPGAERPRRSWKFRAAVWLLLLLTAGLAAAYVGTQLGGGSARWWFSPEAWARGRPAPAEGLDNIPASVRPRGESRLPVRADPQPPAGGPEAAEPAGGAGPPGAPGDKAVPEEVVAANPPGPAVPEPEPEVADLAQRVDEAVAAGVKYLQGVQSKDGSWPRRGPFAVGGTALPALALLECGVPGNDPSVQKAAGFVRREVQRSPYTYDLALAVLLLERLGGKGDEPLIRKLSLQLVAGQHAGGGWDSVSPPLAPLEEDELYEYLTATRLEVYDSKGDLLDGQKPKKRRRKDEPPKEPDPEPVPLAEVLQKYKVIRKSFDDAKLGPRVRALPVVEYTPVEKALRKTPLEPRGAQDNSNTQFALLALWAARRRGLPIGQVVAMAEHRFVCSQNPDGGWGYKTFEGLDSQTTPAMTCVGLLSLGMGHGVLHDAFDRAGLPEKVKPEPDPVIAKGLESLGKAVAAGGGRDDLVFLWGLERVAAAYRLERVGGKDWYPWAAAGLVANQAGDGRWECGTYEGANPVSDTSFALLVLRRSNLAEDLTAWLASAVISG